MAPSNNRNRRPRDEETDSGEEDGYETTPQLQAPQSLAEFEAARLKAIQDAQNRIQMLDLGSATAGYIKSVDKGPAPKINMKALMNEREVNQIGSEAHTSYLKNKKQTNAWNSKYQTHIQEILTNIM